VEFAGVSIVTLSEGPISHLHIGLKGTMNALYLKDLADKTRRGLRGRVEAGKSGGSKSYGYDVVKKLAPDGSPVRGERVINAAEAAIIRRIFTEYAAGMSPRTIARRLNSERVPSPNSKGWGPSTIHGQRPRGTGILNNELYIGRIVWNRMRFIKDPETGKRVPRLNPESEWTVTDVPALRIIDQALWDKAKARQDALTCRSQSSSRRGKFWARQRPRYLLSGLLVCGTCGGSFVKYNAERFSCAAARMKGTCDNRLTIRRDVLEKTVLDGLQHRLMDPELLSVFCEEYTRNMNELRMQRNAARTCHRTEL